MLIGIPVFKDAEILDVTGPYDMFRWAGIDVELTSAEAGPIVFHNDLSINVKTSFADAKRPYDVLWVPGGTDKAVLREMNDPRRTYLDFLIAKAENARIVASVCEGSLLLAAAGLLDGYEATTHWQTIPCFKAFPKVKVVPGHPRYHEDGNRLTGGGVSSGLDEALRLIEILEGTKTAQDVQLITQYYPKPPVHTSIPIATTCNLSPIHVPPGPVPSA
ncbi:DJ-1/PfpI family protein [Nitrospirillum sp. BR 11163]|uniref:DJ-1/PfpI family protein n=1 Tax=Nitrospirillum sp. BR 11163 TaxID=3104323 RepID=UPI002AFE7F9B|nr:DJ-1/PfpI family protein [Nitrospirillum sp. BR 11163]MEA1672996.1 DJ-1/PfpI family protein [Nitrospirillum sp. BR 11163]